MGVVSWQSGVMVLMFNVNDYVMSFSSGVCRITAVKTDAAGSDNMEYYVLSPVYQSNLTIMVPVRSADNLMRPILTREEVLTLIASMPDLETIAVLDYRERTNMFKAALKTRDNNSLIKVIKTLYLEKQSKSSTNQKLNKPDEEIMNAAERQLNEEFAIALQIAPEEVPSLILSCIASQDERA